LRLPVGETRKLARYQKATGLRVTSAVLAGIVWAAENADAGIVEADEIDFAHCLQVRRPCLGPVEGPVEGPFATRTPLMGRSPLFPQDIDPTIRGSSEMSSSSSRAGRR
jgi:homospermidine synthase